MKKTFDQVFDHTKTLVYFLIEVENGRFIKAGFRDELGLDYYNPLKLELDESKDCPLQITKFLYKNGLALNDYRELSRETRVSFGFTDDTPGTAGDLVCLHVRADRTKDFNNNTPTITITDIIDMFSEAPDMPRVTLLGLARLFMEREAIRRL